jgi:hypothetical protein
MELVASAPPPLKGGEALEYALENLPTSTCQILPLMRRMIEELSDLKLMMLANAAYSDDQITQSVAMLAEASTRKTLEAASKLPSEEKGKVELLMARVLEDAQARQHQEKSMDYNEERIE